MSSNGYRSHPTIRSGLHDIARRQPEGLTPPVAGGLADSLVPMFVGFGCLTVTWLCVTIGLWRRADLEA